MSNVSKLGLLSVVVISAAFSASAGASCRIRIIVPDGGDVHAASGKYTCEAGLTCEIAVPDTHCDETFLASPKFGYSFTGWKKHSRGLCSGESATPCGVKNSLAKDHPSEDTNRASGKAFYLEPVFVLDQSNEKPEKISLTCRIDQCSENTLGDRQAAGDSAQRCANVRASAVRILGGGQSNTLNIQSTELSNQVAKGSYEPLPGSAAGWKFIGHIGRPATSEEIILIVQADGDQGRCEIEYIEGANTSNQISLALSGLIEKP